MPQVMDIKDHYLETFSRFEQARPERSSLHWLREAAMSRFAELGFPTTQDEEWRFTNIAPLTQVNCQPAATSFPKQLTALKLDRLTYGPWDCYRLVFVNGAFAPDHSNPPVSQLTSGNSLREALPKDAQALELYLAK